MLGTVCDMIVNDNHTETCDYCNRRVQECEELPPIRQTMEIQTMVLVCPDCRGEYEENWTVYWENRD